MPPLLNQRDRRPLRPTGGHGLDVPLVLLHDISSVSGPTASNPEPGASRSWAAASA